jgi:hypothetical protein
MGTTGRPRRSRDGHGVLVRGPAALYSGQWYAISAVNGNLSRIGRRRRTTHAARAAGGEFIPSRHQCRPGVNPASWPGIASRPRSAPGRPPVRAAWARRGSPGTIAGRLLPAICKGTIRIYDHDCRLSLTRGFRHARATTTHIGPEQPGMHAGAGQCNGREELMILISPTGPGCPDNLPILSIVPGPHEFQRRLTAPRSVRPRAQRAPRQRPPVAGRPGSRPAPAAGHLAACRRPPAGRGRRQRAAAAGQVRRYSAGRQFPHQIPDPSARRSPLPGIRAAPRRGSRGRPDYSRPPPRQARGYGVDVASRSLGKRHKISRVLGLA